MFNFILLAAIIAGVFVRATLLTASIDYDEAYSFLFYMKQNFLTCIGKYNLPNNHILNSLLGWLVQNFFKPEPWVLRIGPFLAGMASLYLIYLGLRAFFDKETSKLSAILAWCTFPYISYSALSRGYIYEILFFFFGLHLLNCRRENGAALAWALALWALPTALYPIALVTVALMLTRKIPWKDIITLAIKTGTFAFILYLPAILYAIVVGSKIFTIAEAPNLNFFLQSYKNIFTYLWFAGALSWFFLLPIFCLYFLPQHKDEKKFLAILIGFIFLISLFNRSVLAYERTWIWATPFLAAFAILGLKRWGGKVTRGFCVLGLFLLLSNSYEQARGINSVPDNNVRVLYQDLERLMKPGDFFLVTQSTGTLLKYWETVEKDRPAYESQPFFISGDWLYSMYRKKAEPTILKEKIGESRFFAVVASDAELIKATELVSNFIGAEVNFGSGLETKYTAAKIYEFRPAL